MDAPRLLACALTRGAPCRLPLRGTRRMRKKAHLLRWRPRRHAQRGETTPRVKPSGAASHLEIFAHPASFSAACSVRRRWRGPHGSRCAVPIPAGPRHRRPRPARPARRAELARRPGHRKALPLRVHSAARRSRHDGAVVGVDVDAANAAIRPRPAPDFLLAALSILSSGAGETMSDSGAIDQTGVAAPVSRPMPSSTGSLYQRVVNGPAPGYRTSVIRVSHLTLFVP